MNEADPGASYLPMRHSQPDPSPPLTEEEQALLRLADGPDTDTDAAQRSLRTALRLPGEHLRLALHGLRVDVADQVMDLADQQDLGLGSVLGGLQVDLLSAASGSDDFFARLEMLDDVTPSAAGMRAGGVTVRGAGIAGLLPSPPLDLTDAIFNALGDSDDMLLSAFGDGELVGPERARVTRRALSDAASQSSLQANGRLGAQVREAATAGASLDLWGTIAGGIGADAGETEGGEEVGVALRRAVAELPVIDISAEVMAQVVPRVRRTSRWMGSVAPLLALAAAAMVLVGIVPGLVGQTGNAVHTGSLSQLAAPFVMAAVNDARVEDLETSKDVVAQVVQFDDGGPTFILVDDSVGTL